MKLSRFVIVLFVLTLFTSCFKEDKPIPYKPLDGITNTAATGTDYSMVVYYDLETNSFVGSHHRERWDLAFDNTIVGDWNAELNGGKKMRVMKLNTQDIKEVTPTPDPASSDWLYDDYDKELISAWNITTGSVDRDFVYIVDLGINLVGNNIGFKKIRILPSAADEYKFEVANLDGSEYKVYSTTKDPNYNFNFFSFEDGGKFVKIEPPRATFDIVFRQFTDKSYYNDMSAFEWYSVNGCLLNHSGNMEVAIDTSGRDFELFTSQDIGNYTFSKKLNAMGYEWKSYSFNTASYTVKDWVFLIKDRKGEYYKLQFLSFVNASGEKGYPTFQIGRL